LEEDVGQRKEREKVSKWSCTVAINDCYTKRTKPGKKNQEIGLASMENELKKTDMTLMSLPRNTS
jgi:hypothetical protein